MTEPSILLVEDNPDDEALALRAFKKNGITDVVVARDGVEALDYLHGKGAFEGRETDKQPNLVILDLKLPRMDGQEVLMHIRTDPKTRLIPVVVLTSSNEEQDLIHTYGLGANSYIRKPVDFKEFIEVTRQLGRYWLSINMSPPMVKEA